MAFAEQASHQMTIPRSRAREWDQLLAAVTRLRREGGPEALVLGNTLYTLFVVEDERFDPGARIQPADSCDPAVWVREIATGAPP
jgi:hypothetical protein